MVNKINYTNFIILVKLVQGRQERLLQVDSQRTKTLLYY